MVDSGTFKTTSYLQESPYFEGAAGVLLSNTDKSGLDAKEPRKPVDPSVDLDRLAVCFGGFSPTAMGADADELKRAVDAVERRMAEQRRAKELASALAAARASDERSWTDEAGVLWRYVVLDDVEVRIERCGLSGDEGSSLTDLAIPGSIEGKPVAAIAPNACSDLRTVERLSMPDTVISIGTYAFSGCRALREVGFSGELASFDVGWLRNCSRLETLRLPGALDKVTPAVFDLPALRSLSIGHGTTAILPGSFAKSRLDAVEVDPANPFLSSDGRAVYSKNGAVLVALATPVATYEVAQGCTAISNKAFSSFAELGEVRLPDGIEIIGDFAYARTGITEFIAPASLRSIGERAFFGCARLARVELDQGLVSIGGNAFSDTAITELAVPATVERLGYPVAANTTLTYSGKDATFRVVGSGGAAGVGVADALVLDEQGGLYRRKDDGLHLVRMLEPAATVYALDPATVAIDEGAFAKHPAIERVVLNEGLREIGAGAFRDAKRLESVDLPDTLERVGDEAFLDTNLAELRIPAALTRIGALALITEGGHRGTREPSLRHIEVDGANPRFRMQSGLLIETFDNGVQRVVLCTAEEPDVVIPEDVAMVASYAFNGARRLRTLAMSERLASVDVRGLAFDCWLENIHIDLAEPVEGRSSFDFAFPNTERSVQQLRLAFGSLNYVSAESLFKYYDSAIVVRSGFDAAEATAQLSLHAQAQLIVERLLDPIYMTPTNRGMMDLALRSHLKDICVDAARHDDKRLIDGLLALGYIDEDNINDVIGAVGAVQDASITNYLLEQKRQRFGASVIDFEL